MLQKKTCMQVFYSLFLCFQSCCCRKNSICHQRGKDFKYSCFAKQFKHFFTEKQKVSWESGNRWYIHQTHCCHLAYHHTWSIFTWSWLHDFSGCSISSQIQLWYMDDSEFNINWKVIILQYFIHLQLSNAIFGNAVLLLGAIFHFSKVM